jgi:chorismate synthase
MLRYLTAGESHGPGLVAILDGMPAQVPVTPAAIDADLGRRMQGYGRGGRMKIEQDRVQLLGGVRHGLTLGSPIGLLIANRDWENWRTTMAVEPPAAGEAAERPPMTRPRPGHADLAGGLKYAHHDLRNVLERASARETAARVAIGAICKCLLAPVGVRLVSHVLELGGVRAATTGLEPEEIGRLADGSPMRCADPAATRQMMARVDEAQAQGTSLGGVFEVQVLGVPVGLGSHVQWDSRLDGRLAQSLMSVQAVKGVEIGPGFDVAGRLGCEVQDEIFHRAADAADGPAGFYRRTNFAGGLEGGITTGAPLVLRAAMKPISTQLRPLHSVDVVSKEASRAGVERTDITAVPAAAVVGEAVVAFEIARAFREKFGGDSLGEMQRNVAAYRAALRAY